jgi:hypothetical protein
MYNLRRKNMKFALLSLIVLVMILGGLLTNKIVNDYKYNGKIKVSKVEVSPKLEDKKIKDKKDKKIDPKKEEEKIEEKVSGYEEINYRVNYRLEAINKEKVKNRVALVEVTLTEEESKYAEFLFVEEKDIESKIEKNKITIRNKNVETNKDYSINVRVRLTGAPAGYKINPKEEEKEETEIKENNINTERPGIIEVGKTSIQGIVKDKEGNIKSNIELVLCKIEENVCIDKKVTYTKEDGSYTFSDVEEGTYKIEINSENEYEIVNEINA